MSSTPYGHLGSPARSEPVSAARPAAMTRPIAPFPDPRAPQPAKRKHDPRAFAEKIKLIAIGGTVAGFGVVWSLVTANVVGVTNRASTAADASTPDGTGANGVTGANGSSGVSGAAGTGDGVSGAQQGSGSFFQGAGVHPPTFVNGTGSTGSGSTGSGSAGSGSAGSVGSGSTSRKLPTVSGFSGFGNFGGPLVVSGSS